MNRYHLMAELTRAEAEKRQANMGNWEAVTHYPGEPTHRFFNRRNRVMISAYHLQGKWTLEKRA